MIYFDAGATTLQSRKQWRAPCTGRWGRCPSPGRGELSGHPRGGGDGSAVPDAGGGAVRRARSERVVFTSSATHGLNIAIRTLVKPGGRVVISGYEHNAVTRPLHAIPGVEITVADAPLSTGRRWFGSSRRRWKRRRMR